MKKENFKICPMCETTWDTRESFLTDPELLFNGYQPDFGILDQGLFYFTHLRGCCGSTLILEVENFLSLHPDRIHKEQYPKEPSCNCHEQNKLDRCRTACKNASVREISQLIRDRFKHPVFT